MVRTLKQVCAQVGYPRTIRIGNSSEFVFRDLEPWAYSNEVFLDFSRPGKPIDNGFIEAFNSKLRLECLNARRHCRSDQWRDNGTFMNLAGAQEKLEDSRRHYNEDRPYSTIGCNVPITLHYLGGAASPPPCPSRKTPASGGPILGAVQV